MRLHPGTIAVGVICGLALAVLLVRTSRHHEEPERLPPGAADSGDGSPVRLPQRAQHEPAHPGVPAPIIGVPSAPVLGSDSAGAAHLPVGGAPAPRAGGAPPSGTAPLADADNDLGGDKVGDPLPEDIPSLGRIALSHADAERRIEAINMLAATEDLEALPLLRQALSDEDAEVRLAVIDSLSELDFPGNAGADLVSIVVTEDPEPENREKALEALVVLESDRLGAMAHAALNDPDEGVRTAAADILSKLSTPSPQ